MFAADTSSLRIWALSGLAILAVSATICAGASLIQRPRAMMAVPQMVDRPVVFPDGHTIHVQQYELSISEWNQCFDAGACSLKLRARPDQAPITTPATGLSYVDVQEYLTWLNDQTGGGYRLPTTAEWEFMAAPVLPKEHDPIFTDPSLRWASAYLTEGVTPRALKPRGSFSTSPHGVADLDGSVWEWTQDCYAGESGEIDPTYCPAFYVGGEHVAAMSFLVRDPARGGCAVGTPPAHLGMRMVIDAAESPAS